MKLTLVLAFSLMLLGFTACKSSQNNPPSDDDLRITMRKTMCFGQCPTYEIKIYQNGYVKLKGEKHVPHIGIFEAQLSKKDLQALTQKFDASNFFDFKDVYEVMMTDLPTTYLTYQKDGKTKDVRRMGDAPEALISLEDAVAKLLNDLKWKKIGELQAEEEN
jgi:hypothetical protein